MGDVLQTFFEEPKLDPSTRDLCIVICHYNARPAKDLIELLDQLVLQVERLKPAIKVMITVVVNMGIQEPLRLPERLSHIGVMYRENEGYNIGAWDYGWRNMRKFYGYLFLQDECKASNGRAIVNYWMLLNKYPNSLFGESMFFFRGWSGFKRAWPENYALIKEIAFRNKIELGLSASHLQTLILAATDQTMEKIGGFISSNDKIEAIACEVLISRKASSQGIEVEQTGWRPFFNFSHPQWESILQKSLSTTWSVSKAIWYISYGWRDLCIRPFPSSPKKPFKQYE